MKVCSLGCAFGFSLMEFFFFFCWGVAFFWWVGRWVSRYGGRNIRYDILPNLSSVLRPKAMSYVGNLKDESNMLHHPQNPFSLLICSFHHLSSSYPQTHSSHRSRRFVNIFNLGPAMFSLDLYQNPDVVEIFS